MKIYKYKLQLTGKTVLEIPRRSEALSVAAQGDDVVLYVRINEDPAKNETRAFFAYPTGSYDDGRMEPIEFIGTVNVGSKSRDFPHGFFFHVFEVDA